MSAPTSARLGEDAAAETGEDGDQRAAEAEADERVDGLLLVSTSKIAGEDAVVAGHAEQRQADDEHAGDGAAAEGDVERRADAAAGGLGHAGVGAHRDVHADEAGRGRRQAADGEADRDLDVLQRDQRDEQHDADAGDRRVLAASDRPARPPGRRPRCSRIVSLPGESASSDRDVSAP